MSLRKAVNLGLVSVLVVATFLLGLVLGCRYAIEAQAEKDAGVLTANLEAINWCLESGCDEQLQQAIISQNDIALLSFRSNEKLLERSWLLGSVGAALLYYGHMGVQLPASQSLTDAYERLGCGIHNRACAQR